MIISMIGTATGSAADHRERPHVDGIVLGVLGLAVGGSGLGPDMLFAEVVDDDYVRTGQRREDVSRDPGFIFRFPPALAGLVLGGGWRWPGSTRPCGEPSQAVITSIRVCHGVAVAGSRHRDRYFSCTAAWRAAESDQEKAAALRRDANDAYRNGSAEAS